jgi:hypothetical protein
VPGVCGSNGGQGAQKGDHLFQWQIPPSCWTLGLDNSPWGNQKPRCLQLSPVERAGDPTSEGGRSAGRTAREPHAGEGRLWDLQHRLLPFYITYGRDQLQTLQAKLGTRRPRLFRTEEWWLQFRAWPYGEVGPAGVLQVAMPAHPAPGHLDTSLYPPAASGD